jgi:hypothetical protein
LLGLLCGGVRKGIPKRVEDCEVKVMSLDYKNWSYGETSISSDTDTVERALMSGEVKPQAPSASDLRWALEWLAIYQSNDHKEVAQAFGNVIAFLELTAQSKEKRSNLAQAKKKFAEANGIPVSQVRINRNN